MKAGKRVAGPGSGASRGCQLDLGQGRALADHRDDLGPPLFGRLKPRFDVRLVQRPPWPETKTSASSAASIALTEAIQPSDEPCLFR